MRENADLIFQGHHAYVSDTLCGVEQDVLIMSLDFLVPKLFAKKESKIGYFDLSLPLHALLLMLPQNNLYTDLRYG